MPFRSFPRRKTSPTTADLFGAPEPLPGKHLVAHVDGGARGNPGPAGYGVVLEDESGRAVAKLSKYLGHQTNNYAEYMGLLAALQYTLEHGYKALEVVSDSELLVRQMNGQYRVRAPQLIGLHQEAKSLAARLEVFRVRHVRREHNRQADALANRAMDEGMGAKG